MLSPKTTLKSIALITHSPIGYINPFSHSINKIIPSTESSPKITFSQSNPTPYRGRVPPQFMIFGNPYHTGGYPQRSGTTPPPHTVFDIAGVLGATLTILSEEKRTSWRLSEIVKKIPWHSGTHLPKYVYKYGDRWVLVDRLNNIVYYVCLATWYFSVLF